MRFRPQRGTALATNLLSQPKKDACEVAVFLRRRHILGRTHPPIMRLCSLTLRPPARLLPNRPRGGNGKIPTLRRQQPWPLGQCPPALLLTALTPVGDQFSFSSLNSTDMYWRPLEELPAVDG